MIDALLDSLATAQTAFHDGISALAFRGKGLKPSTKGGQDSCLWNGMVVLRPYAPGTDLPATIVSRDYGHLMNLTAHQNLAQKALALDMEPHLLACADLLRRAVPVLAGNTGMLHLAIPVDHEGDLGTPLWRVAHHGLHGLSPIGPSRKAMAALFADLAQEPEPTGLYRIGNKTYAADGPHSAIAQHVRLLAPKTPKRQRKLPAHLPEIKRVWDSRQAKAMAQEVLESWKKR